MATQTVPAEVVDLKKHPTLDVLIDVLEQYLAPADRDQVLAAYEYAEAKHEGHLRRSGHPYIEHPLADRGDPARSCSSTCPLCKPHCCTM